jgi:hypothetical protein
MILACQFSPLASYAQGPRFENSKCDEHILFFICTEIEDTHSNDQIEMIRISVKCRTSCILWGENPKFIQFVIGREGLWQNLHKFPFKLKCATQGKNTLYLQ